MKINLIKIVAIIVTVSMLPCAVMAQGNGFGNLNNKMNVSSFNIFLQGAKVDLGFYSLKRSEDLICVQMIDNRGGDRQHYMIENCFRADEIESSNGQYSTVTRKSGVLGFEKFSTSTGEFTFRKDPEFVAFLEKEGIALNNDPYYFKLFLGDIDEAYILDIKNIGFKPTITELGRLVWHDASIQFIEAMTQLIPDASLEDISMMSAFNVTTDNVKEFIELGVVDIDAHAIKKAKSHGVTPLMIKREQQRGNNFSDLRSYIRLNKKK